PRHLKQQIVEGTPDGYAITDPTLCLIDAHDPEPVIREAVPGFWSYLEQGKERGIHQGYLASRRVPWYSQEERRPAPFLCTYMGRVANGRGPFRFIWNKSGATASNLYLLLYPRGILAEALAADGNLYEAIFLALRKLDADAFFRENIVYGSGLFMMETKEIA